jgi:hypothetical protein
MKLPSKVILEALRIQHPDLQTTGFKKLVRETLAKEGEDEFDREDIEDAVSNIHVVPDAFLVDREIETMVIYEIEVTNPLAEHKLMNYVSIAMDLASFGWSTALMAVNRRGEITQVNLPLFLAHVVEQE